jgi:hypothetical protein
MVEEASYTYREAPSMDATYGYTYKEPSAIAEVPHHGILNKLRHELPHLAYKIPHIATSAKAHTPAAQRAILGIAHGFLVGEEGLLKMKLEQMKWKEASGRKLTADEIKLKERTQKMLDRIQYLKRGVDEKKEVLEKEHGFGKYKQKLEEVV